MFVKEYSIDVNYFSEINIENSYWAGFIAADGCIYQNGTLSIELQNRDSQHLVKFKNAIDFTGPIQTRKRNNQKLIQITCADYTFRNDLNNNFNIVPNKSLVLLPPKLEHEQYIRAFIRGNLDGDGTICFHKKLKHWSIQFNGTYMLLDWINHNIQNLWPYVGQPSVCKSKNIFKLTFKGYQTEGILNWLYENSIVETRLDRKYNKYLELKEFYNRGERNKQ